MPTHEEKAGAVNRGSGLCRCVVSLYGLLVRERFVIRPRRDGMLKSRTEIR
jgi:hypothetical protein